MSLRQLQTFPRLPPGSPWCTNPFRLCSLCQPQSSPCDPTAARASAPSPARPGGGADEPLGLVSAARRRASVRESLRFALRTPVAALSSVAPKLPLRHPQSPPAKGLLVHGHLSSFSAPSPWCRPRPYSFVSVISFFFCPTQVCGGVSCLLGGLRSSASVQEVFCSGCSTCRCISDVSVGRKVISASYFSAILKVFNALLFLKCLRL